MSSFVCAPVLIIGFNRPEFVRRLIDAVRVAKPPRLYIAVDGPRADRPEECVKCAAVRECAKLVDWPCEVLTQFQDNNLGCKHAPVSAIDWFFNHEEKGIVLEDDVLPTPDFFAFVTEMLERYRDDERVGMVSGFNFFGLQRDQSRSYHFSRNAMMSGGWATWRRVWRFYDIEMREYLPHLDEIIKNTPMTPYHRRVFKMEVLRAHSGKDAWDYQFTMMLFATRKLGVVPRVQLVTNVGINVANATHTGGYNYYAPRWMISGKMDNPIVAPNAVICDEWADCMRQRMEKSILPRALTWVGSKMPWSCGIMSAIGRTIERFAPICFR